MRRATLGTHLTVYRPGADLERLCAMAEWKSQGGMQRRTVQLWAHNPTADAVRLPRALWPLPPEFGEFDLRDRRLLIDPPIRFPRAKAAHKLHPTQDEAARRVWQAGGGILTAPGGSGKTVISWRIIAAWQQPALWVVDSELLVQQSLAEARRAFALPDSAFGVALDGSINPGTHITVGTRQTLANGVTRRFAERFGTFWVDEIDKAASRTYSALAQQFPARHRGGATATIRRADGLHPAVFAVFGPVVAEITEQQAVDMGRFMRPEVEWVRTGLYYPWPGDWPALQGQRAGDPVRNNLIARRAAREVAAGFSALVLCQRIEQAQVITDILRANKVDARILTSEVRDEIQRMRIAAAKDRRLRCIVATPVLGRGIDIPAVDRLLVADGFKSETPAEQQAFRSTRTDEPHGKQGALIIEFADGGPQFEKQQWARRRLYDRRGWKQRGALPHNPRSTRSAM